jgi:protein involved in polysaccharide export with SLBB domain
MRRIQLKRGIELASEFDLYDLLLRGDKSRDVRLLPGDVVYIPPAGPQVAIGGSVKNAAIYELKDARVVGDLIAMAGGLSSLADRGQAVLERIRKSGSREVLELRLDESGLKTELADGDVLHVRLRSAATWPIRADSPGVRASGCATSYRIRNRW